MSEKQQRRVAVFSLEMEKHEILDRILVGKLGAEKFMRFKNGTATDDEMKELRLAVERFEGWASSRAGEVYCELATSDPKLR